MRKRDEIRLMLSAARSMEVTASNVTRLPEDNHDPAHHAHRRDGWWQIVDAAGAHWKIAPDPTEVTLLLGDS